MQMALFQNDIRSSRDRIMVEEQNKAQFKDHNECMIGGGSFLFEWWLSVPVNSYGHVGTLPLFYGSCTQT